MVGASNRPSDGAYHKRFSAHKEHIEEHSGLLERPKLIDYEMNAITVQDGK